LRHIYQFAIGQLQCYFPAQAGYDLFTYQQAFAFEYLTLEAVERNSKNLTYKTFYDGDDSAHKAGSEVGAVKSLKTVKHFFDLKTDNLTKERRHKLCLFRYGITGIPSY